MAASYQIDEIKDTSVTLYINKDTQCNYYRVFARLSSNPSDETYDEWWEIQSNPGLVMITGLQPGTSYTINVAYSPTGTAENSTWIGSTTIETTGAETPTTPTICYATLSFNANGGSGAPSTIHGQSNDGTGYVQFDIPDQIPTRSGYSFQGWATNSEGTGMIRQPGGTYTGYGTSSSPGQNHTLYAVWKDKSGYAYIWNGYQWIKAVPYIYSYGIWHQTIPYVYEYGQWKQATN